MDHELKTNKNSKRIFIGSDHAGFELKEKLIDYLVGLGFEVSDQGAFEYDKQDDYPDFISKVARKVSENPKKSLGIILGGSGQGEAIVANRFENVRAVVYYGGNIEIIKLSREHNDANILSLGARFVDEEEAKSFLKIWLETEFSGEERHKRRIEKIDKLGEFDKWNGIKKNINFSDKKPFFKERDIFYIKNGKNVGFEQDGKGENFARPVLVFKKFNNDIFWGIPLSKTKKTGKYYFQFSFANDFISNALLSQMRLFDAKRLMGKEGVINIEDYESLKTKISQLFVD